MQGSAQFFHGIFADRPTVFFQKSVQHSSGPEVQAVFPGDAEHRRSQSEAGSDCQKILPPVKAQRRAHPGIDLVKLLHRLAERRGVRKAKNKRLRRILESRKGSTSFVFYFMVCRKEGKGAKKLSPEKGDLPGGILGAEHSRTRHQNICPRIPAEGEGFPADPSVHL